MIDEPEPEDVAESFVDFGRYPISPPARERRPRIRGLRYGDLHLWRRRW